MLHERDVGVAGELLGGGAQHVVGEVDAHRGRTGVRVEQHASEASVAGAEVEDPSWEHALEVADEHGLAFRAVREVVDARQVAGDLLGIGPGVRHALANAGITSRPKSRIIAAWSSKLPNVDRSDAFAGSPAPNAAWMCVHAVSAR